MGNRGVPSSPKPYAILSSPSLSLSLLLSSPPPPPDDSKTVMFSLSHKNEGKLCCLVNQYPQTGNITVDTPATPSSSTLTSAEGVWGL